ncbi:hypothetical protein [Thermomonospora umbrina]|uniref:Guanylate cyclase domain-containing protein n=1 Tax=Thermomonospora umbrina TaxID=111806 RepID=A0A3D9SXG6_9ACTN|nr:hypothetical protein [Thermomonospora umbrina]REF00539.1 hypothetical protein DFJ69_6087 [Thermomonospora umbrina]
MIERAVIAWQRLGTISPARGPQHRLMFAVDIAGFGSRPPRVQTHLRHVLERVVKHACQAAGLPPHSCRHEHRGDSAFVITPLGTDFAALLGPLPQALASAVDRHNALAADTAQMRLRMAAHAGYVHIDRRGVSGNDAVLLFRLLDAPPLKDHLANSPHDLAVIVSDYLYDVAVAYHVIKPAHYRQADILCKETAARAWIKLP